MSTIETPRHDAAKAPAPPVAVPTGIEMLPDDSRVVARLFVPGLEEVGPTGSRAGAVIDRVLNLSEEQVVDALMDVIERFSARHRNLLDLFTRHADRVLTLLEPDLVLSDERRALLGACFTHEYSIESAGLCNPSIVLMPETGSDDGGVRFVMSVRGIGEGHRSSIGFRTGWITREGSVLIDQLSPHAFSVTGTPGLHHRSVLHSKLDNLGVDFGSLAAFIGTLPPVFDDAALALAISTAANDLSTPHLDSVMVGHITELTRWSYVAEFPDDSHLSERVLWPHAPPEFHGMEDARFVRFVADDGEVTYYGTYTAFERGNISLQLLETRDFRTFSSTPMAGSAASGKGLALFPRKVNGRFWALTRADRETNGIASSDDIRHWPISHELQFPHEPWEVLQLGNCGSPIEVDEGWLVITHGVGAMRTYRLGALLLDKEDPTRVIRRAEHPILEPLGDRQDGYVPNVVYSCGAAAHGDTLVLPFGVGDQRISICTMSIRELIAFMTPM